MEPHGPVFSPLSSAAHLAQFVTSYHHQIHASHALRRLITLQPLFIGLRRRLVEKLNHIIENVQVLG